MKKFDIQSIQVSMYPKKMDIHVSKYPCIQVCMISKYPIIQVSKKISIQGIQVSGYQKKVVSTHTYVQSLEYTGRTLTIENKHKSDISTRYTPSCPTIQYDVYPIVSDTTLIPHLLQYIQLRKELTLCADLKLHNCYCTCSSINSFLVYISGLICQNHQNYKAMNWKTQFFYNIY